VLWCNTLSLSVRRISNLFAIINRLCIVIHCFLVSFIIFRFKAFTEQTTVIRRIIYIGWQWRDIFIPTYVSCSGRRDVVKGYVNILQHLQSDGRYGARTKLSLNWPIQFYFNNVTNLNQLNSQSTTSYLTTRRSYRDHGLMWRHSTLSIMIGWGSLIIISRLKSYAENSIFSGTGRAVVCVCVRTIPFELNDIWPRYMACWFSMTLPRWNSTVKVKIHGHVRKAVLFRLRTQSVIGKVQVKFEKPVTAQFGKMQAVTTLRPFQCAVPDVCALPTAVVLTGYLSSPLW